MLQKEVFCEAYHDDTKEVPRAIAAQQGVGGGEEAIVEQSFLFC